MISMKRLYYRLCLVTCLCVILGGCAYSKTTVPLNFKSDTSGEKVDISVLIGVQKLKDIRGTDPYLLANKGVQGKTSGTYVAEKEIADIVTDALKTTLQDLNYRIAGAKGDLILTGEILKFDSNAIMGFWSGQVECIIQLNLKLIENSSGKMIWNGLFSGSNKKGGVQVDGAGHRKIVMEAALQDVMKNFAQSREFRDAVQSYKSRT